MAELISKDQRIITGITSPKAAYSRQVQIVMLVPGGVGNTSYIVTPGLGANTWLLGVDVWLFADATTLIGGLIWVLTGKAKQVDFGGMTTTWDSVVDMPTVSAKSLVWYAETNHHFHWDMQRLYKSPGARFALCGQNLRDQRWWGIASFHISEG